MTERDIDIDSMVIQAYLDGELEGTDLAELERQLSTSKELRERVEEAEREHLALREMLRPPRAPAALRTRVMAQLDVEDRHFMRSRLRAAASWSLPAASVLAAAAALVLFMVRTGQPGEVEPTMTRGDAVTPRIATTQARPMPVVASTVAAEADAPAFDRYFASPISPPRFAAQSVRLDGWRPARLRGYEAVELQYTVVTASGAHQLAVHILDARNLDVSGQRTILAAGHTLWLDRPLGFSSVTYQDRSGIGYVFTSDMEESELTALVMSSDLLHGTSSALR